MQFYLGGFTEYEQDLRKKIVLRIIKELNLVSVKFLDIGCSEGTFTLQIASALGTKEIYGVEISPQACQIALKRGISVHQIDLDNSDHLPFQDNYFDFIHMGEVIEHVFDTDKVLEEIKRILKPSGVLLVSTPNLGAWYNRLALLFGFQPFNTSVSLKYYSSGKLFKGKQALCVAGAEHIHVGTLYAWKELFEVHKLRCDRIYGVSVTRKSIPKVVLFIDNILSRFPALASVLIFVLRKNPVVYRQNYHLED